MNVVEMPEQWRWLAELENPVPIPLQPSHARLRHPTSKHVRNAKGATGAELPVMDEKNIEVRFVNGNLMIKGEKEEEKEEKARGYQGGEEDRGQSWLSAKRTKLSRKFAGAHHQSYFERRS